VSSRNDPRRRVQGAALDGLGALNVPIIDQDRVNPNRPTMEELMSPEELPDPGWTPGGAMMAVQIVQGAGGETREGKVIIPDNVKWVTCVYAVLATGPECKWYKRGDHVLVLPNVEPAVVRYRGISSMFIHEQQAHGYVNEVRERNERAAASADAAGTSTVTDTPQAAEQTDRTDRDDGFTAGPSYNHP
jgi:hypothetical protein